MSVTTAKDKLASLVDVLVSSLLESYSVSLTAAQTTELKRVAAAWLDATQTKVVTLADNKPDYNQILLQFQNMLEHEDAWKDTLTAGTGQAFLRLVSTAVSYAVFAQERATQERYSYFARLPSSIYASARSLGVRLSRRGAPKVTVALTRNGMDIVTIPAFTAFIVGTNKFFSTKDITFNKDNISPSEVELTQGEVFLDTYNSPGQPFATYEVGHGNSTISEDNVYLYVDGEEYTRVTNGLYNYGPNEKVFYENTMANGNVEIITGSGNFGAMPSSNANIRIRYATTLGVDAHTSVTDIPVFCPDFSNVIGTTITAVQGGTIPKTLEFYKVNAPFIRAKNDRAVLRREYELTALDYKDLQILDARTIGQQEIAPTKKWAAGVIKLCALTSAPMSDVEWNALTTYVQGKAIEGFTIVRENPVAIPVDISVRLGINSAYALEAARLAAVAAISNNYAPKAGVLGHTFYRVDVSAILLNSKDPALKDAIDWIDIVAPTQVQIDTAWNEYIKINNITITTEYTQRASSARIGYNV